MFVHTLKENEVFVFGANARCFHGGGAAGYAQFGNPKNGWRENTSFQLALTELNKKNKNLPYDKSLLIGNWSVLGSIGFMVGNVGKSYGVVTTEAPGKKGIVDSEFLKKELVKFLEFSKAHPEYIFLCADFGLKREYGGLSWWSPEDLNQIWELAFVETFGIKLKDIRNNVFNNITLPSYLVCGKDVETNLIELFK